MEIVNNRCGRSIHKKLPIRNQDSARLEKRLHEAKLSGTRSNPALNEIHPRPRAEGRAREGAVDRRSKAGLTHLPCNLLELRTTKLTGTNGAQRNCRRCSVLLALKSLLYIFLCLTGTQLCSGGAGTNIKPLHISVL